MTRRYVPKPGLSREFLMRSKFLGAVVVFAGLAQSSFGASITNGHFDISGTLFVTNFSTAAVVTPGGTCPASALGMACIFWQDPAGTTADKVSISSTGLPNGDIPVAMSGVDAANISNLNNPPEIVGNPGFAPTTFMTFNNGGITTTLALNFIDPGFYSTAQCGLAAAPGQQCTPAGSFINFVNNPPPPGQATATWVFEGTTVGNPNPQSHWVGNFTSQFPLGTPYQTVLNELSTVGWVSNTFSATITLTTGPEPGTMVLMIGTGLIGLAVFLGRRRLAK